jgi:hypothetical protein
MANKPWISGLFYLAGACLSGFYLLWYGILALLGATFIKAFDAVAQSEVARPTDVSDLVNSGAIMASVGLCLTFGLLSLSFRRLLGKPYPGRRTIVVYLVVSTLVVSSAAWKSWQMNAPEPIPANYPGLEGIWHIAGDSKHTFRFNPDGTLSSWWSSLGHGKAGKWTRTGQTVNVTYVTDWTFSGTLAGSSIKGTMSVTSTGKVLGPQEWVRDVRP